MNSDRADWTDDQWRSRVQEAFAGEVKSTPTVETIVRTTYYVKADVTGAEDLRRAAGRLRRAGGDLLRAAAGGHRAGVPGADRHRLSGRTPGWSWRSRSAPTRRRAEAAERPAGPDRARGPDPPRRPLPRHVDRAEHPRRCASPTGSSSRC